jgi:hypothetical protein
MIVDPLAGKPLAAYGDRRQVSDWLDLHHAELMKDWALAQVRKPLKPIAPLESLLMFLHTTTVTVLLGFRLQITFNNSMVGEICLLDELWGEMFEPLKEGSVFATAQQHDEMGTVAWSNGAAFAPEFLLELMQRQPRHLIRNEALQAHLVSYWPRNLTP